MQPLDMATNDDAGECTNLLLTMVPRVMRIIRNEMRDNRPSDLSVPQFRTLGFLHRRGGASVSDVAGYLGLTLPTVSRMVDLLVKRGLVRREECPEDRRRVTLVVTETGWSVYGTALGQTQERLAKMLSPLSPDELGEVSRAMRLLEQTLHLRHDSTDEASSGVK